MLAEIFILRLRILLRQRASLQMPNLRRAALATAGAVVVSLASGSAGQAAVLKTAYYTIDAMAMGSGGVSSDTNYTIGLTDGVRNAAPDSACFNTAVNLPQGATITAVTLWYTAAAGGVTFTVLLRHQLASGVTESVAQREIGSTNNRRKGVNLTLSSNELDSLPRAASRQKIDNRLYSYAFGVCLNGENKAAFHAARITYTYLD